VITRQPRYIPGCVTANGDIDTYGYGHALPAARDAFAAAGQNWHRHDWQLFELRPVTDTPDGLPAPEETLDSQIDRLAAFIIAEVPGEPSQTEGVVDTAIRLLRALAPGRPDSPAAAESYSGGPLLDDEPPSIVTDGVWVTAKDRSGTGLTVHASERAALRHAYQHPGMHPYWLPNGVALPVVRDA
jgi:hypothetical protein